MIQYYELKEKHPDSILFFRMGDFYEMFDDDAHIAHKVLGINITTRNKNAAEPIPLAGIPYHAKDKYLPILVNAGYKVAIAEQVSDPKLKWIVKREVVRIITPSTLNLEGENYTNDEATSYIVSICGENWIYGISFLESSSWKWKTWVLENREKLSWEIYKIAPKEVILEKKLFNDESLKEILEKKYSLNIYYFDTDKKYKEKLLSHFWVKNLEGFWIENKPLAIKSSILLLEYLKTNQQSSLEHLNSISSESFSNFLELDESTIRNLDLIYNIATKSSTIWTLFWVLDNTKTPMWKRFLKEAIVNPLRDKEKIQNRLDITDEFLNNQQLLNSIREKLKYVVDLDNILTRLALWRANPKDLLNLKKSLETILEVIDLIKKEGSANLNNLLHL